MRIDEPRFPSSLNPQSAIRIPLMKFVSPEEAVSVIKSGDRVFVHSVAASSATSVRFKRSEQYRER